MKSLFALLAPCILLLLLAGCSTPGHRAEQRAAAFHRLSPEDQKLVLHGHVRAGLSKDAVYIAWGPPDWRSENGKGKISAETWIYERQLSVYAPLGSYDQVYPSLGLYGPRFGFGTLPGYGYGSFANEGFLYPRAIVTDVRFERADFIDGRLRRYEVRRGAHTLDVGMAAEAPAARKTLTNNGSAVRCTAAAPPRANLFLTVAYPSLNAFINALDKAGELRRISYHVATELEITEIADREMKSAGGGKALLFEQPTIDGKPSRFPLAINTMGSERRMALALGIESVDDLAHQMQLILKAKPPTNLKQGWNLLKQGVDLLHARPKKVKDGPCKEVITRFDRGSSGAGTSLLDLPILKCWPQDGGRFVTLPNVYTRDPDTGERNVGMYRMQVYDGQTTGMHWQVHKVGARHGKRYYERGERMPVAVCLGGDPAYTFAATAPLPDGLDEILFAGFARKKSVELVRCETIDLEVPADVDFVLEGYVQPGESRPEGPFGDHTGFYTPVDDYPVFHLTAITHRKDAVYPATIVGVPPMEDFYIGAASVRVFLPVFKMNFPEIVDLALPAEGVFHNLVFVSIRKQYPFQAYKIMHGLWGMGQMMFSKYIVVVDEDCDVQNTSEVLFRLCANTDPQRDSTFIKSPCDSLDHAPTVANIGSHMGFDATRKLSGEGYTRAWPELVKMDPTTKTRVDALFATDAR